MTNLTAEKLRQLLDYDPATGIFTWRISRGPCKSGAIAGSVHCKGYREHSIDCERYLAHHLAWLHFYGKWPHGDIDHRDRNPSNNAITNLRTASKTANRANQRRRKDSSTGFKCVAARGKSWRAYVRINGRYHHLGYFPTPKEAHAAYMKAAERLFGEFAYDGE